MKPITISFRLASKIRQLLLINNMVLCLCSFLWVADTNADTNMMILNDQVAGLQYSMGYFMGSAEELKNINIDPEILILGIQDTLTNQLKLSEEEMTLVLLNLGEKYIAQINTLSEKKKAYLENNQAFLQQNKLNEGVITTETGLQYLILKSGNGSTPNINSRVSVNFQGTLINGHVFESSDQYSKPVSFEVSQVIPGWSEALQLMSVGSKWRLFIPSELGYGSKGVEHLIPPDSTLILEVELVSIN